MGADGSVACQIDTHTIYTGDIEIAVDGTRIRPGFNVVQAQFAALEQLSANGGGAQQTAARRTLCPLTDVKPTKSTDHECLLQVNNGIWTLKAIANDGSIHCEAQCF